LFIQMMLKDMRSAAVMDESQHSSYMDFYTDMYDKQISVMLSQQGGIGIADMMLKQMEQYLPEGQKSATQDGKELPVYRLPELQSNELSRQLPMPVMNYVAANPMVKTHELDQLQNSDTTITANSDEAIESQNPALLSQTLEPFYGWQQADSFVKDLWPHAEKAAGQLGVSAQVLVAQSALETGWGKHAMKKADGSVAFNLFGIKAGSSWAGQSVTHNTLEFRHGSMQQETANFRAYDSVADALDDYVSFVKTRSRYAQALNHDGSDSHYVKGLQKAGYATDPAYASKINSIMNSQTFKQAASGLATSQQSTNQQILS
ncbi:MAG: flagellar assembly peptidoglycan hydrolase FlgJ, partial [Gammaproteobacteria bacterium]|nr:flagellar assembly peptidoglycan hydrolase FlgJ [Gammaproteobacteria bacterium]